MWEKSVLVVGILHSSFYLQDNGRDVQGMILIPLVPYPNSLHTNPASWPQALLSSFPVHVRGCPLHSMCLIPLVRLLLPKQELHRRAVIVCMHVQVYIYMAKINLH